MRVIAGSAGGIPLFAPKAGMRPTMDRVKEAIFSSLGERVPGARVLDLFAGTGALGIEALSRGAAEAVFVEQHKPTTQILWKNLEKTRLSGRVVCADVFRFLARDQGEPYDIIFADPPYAKSPGDPDLAERLVNDPRLRMISRPGGAVVIEHDPSTFLGTPPQLTPLWTRNYGKTAVAIFLREV